LKLNIVIKEKDKQILTIVIFVIIIVVDLVFILGWQWRLLSGYFKNAHEKKQAIVALEADVRSVEDYKKEIVNLEEKIAQKKLLIIDEMDVSALIENISNLADKSGVKITQIKPVIHSEPKFVQARDSRFGEIEFQLIAKSDFHQLGNFISKLESAKSFLKLSALEISTDNRNYFVQNIGLSLKSFVNLKD